MVIKNKEMFTRLIREKARPGKARNPWKKEYQRKDPGHEVDTSMNMTSQHRKVVGEPERTQESMRKGDHRSDQGRSSTPC